MPEKQNNNSPNFFQRIFLRKKSAGYQTSPVEDSEKKRSRSIGKFAAKIFLYFLAVIFALIILTLVFIDQVLHFGITVIGGAVTGSSISLDEIELSLRRGDLKVVNLQISNPDGFNSGKMLELGTFYIAIDKSSLLTADIVIKDIQLHKLHVTADVNSSGKLNFLKVVENIVPPATGSQTTAAMLVLPAASIAPNGTSVKYTIPPAPEKSVMLPRVWIDNLDISDIQFHWQDSRAKLGINNFGVTLQNIAGSLTAGDIQVKNIQIFNPDGYEKKHLLSLETVAVNLLPETAYSPAPVIKSVEVSGLKACAEFNKSGDFNILQIVESLQDALAPQTKTENNTEVKGSAANTTAPTAPAASEPDSPVPPANTDEAAEATAAAEPELRRFVLSDSSFTIYNDMLKLPIIIPLALVKDEVTFSVGDIDIFPWLHEQAVALRDICLSVTDAKDLVVQMVNSSAESGMKLLDSTAKGGAALIDTTTDALDKTAKSGLKIINQTGENGKKTLKKIVNIFQ